ncbi:MAG: hypothetical protein ABR575_01735 [Actinomycetota bacterium]
MKRHPAPPGATTGEEVVVVLDVEPVPEPSRPPPRMRGLHALGTSGMAIAALAGICAMLALITVNWTDELRRYVVITIVGSVVGFLVFASLALCSAATHSHGPPPDDQQPEDRPRLD